MPQPVDAALCELRPTCCPPHVILHDFLRQRRPVVLTQHTTPAQMTVVTESSGEPHRERHESNTSALRGRDVPFPLRALNTELPLREIDVTSLQRHDFTTPQPRF